MKLTQTPKTRSISFIVVILLFVSVSPAISVTVQEITRGLACPCGCNMIVSACEGSMECSHAKQITDQVSKMIDKGKSKNDIIRFFVNSYGEKILAVPTKKGFNLTAWILPFFAIILGAGIVYIFLNRSIISRKNTESRINSSETQALDKKYIDQFEKELKDFDV